MISLELMDFIFFKAETLALLAISSFLSALVHKFYPLILVLLILDLQELKYSKNPLNKNLLDDMINIYNALNENQKAYLCSKQKDLIIQTIEKSGDGKSEETAICVLTAGEVLQQLEKLIKTGPKGQFDQKMKQLSDGSILTIYRIEDREVFVKLVGGYFL